MQFMHSPFSLTSASVFYSYLRLRIQDAFTYHILQLKFCMYFHLPISATCSVLLLPDFCIAPTYDNRDSVGGIATGYGLDDRGVGVRVPVGSKTFSSPRRPDRLWGPPNLLSNGYRRLFPRG
jgi:hypothetical protein